MHLDVQGQRRTEKRGFRRHSSTVESLAEKEGFALLPRHRSWLSIVPESVSLLVTPGTKHYQILVRVIAEAAPRLDVMDLKVFR